MAERLPSSSLILTSALILAAGCDDGGTGGTGANGGDAGTTSSGGTGGAGGAGGTGASGATGGSGGTGGTGGSGGVGGVGGSGGGGGSGDGGGGGTGGSGGGGGGAMSACQLGQPGSGMAATATCVVGVTHADLQTALDDTTCPDVGLPAGDYAGSFTVNRNVSLVGDGRDATALVGDGTATVLTISGTATVAIDDLEILGGSAVNGGGLSVDSDASATLTNVDVCENDASGSGGGIFVAGDVTLDNSLVRLNAVTQVMPPGASGGGVAVAPTGTLTVNNGTQVTENSVTGGTVAGGGIGIAGTATITGSSITDNSVLANAPPVDASGGGIACYGSLTLVGADVNQNTASAQGTSGVQVEGGGITMLACDLNMTDSHVDGNEANINASTSGGIHGGGLHVQSSTFHITGSTIDGNTLTGSAPAYAGFSNGGNGLLVAYSGAIADPALISNCSIDGNTETVNSPMTAPMIGGGLLILGSKVRFAHSSITNNSVSTPSYDFPDGAMDIFYASAIEMFNTTVSGNSPGGISWYGASQPMEPASITLRHVTAWNNAGSVAFLVGGSATPDVDISNSIVQDIICFSNPTQFSSGLNVFSSHGGCASATSDGTDPSDTIDPAFALTPLTLNVNTGNMTRYHPLPTGSGAIDVVPLASCTDIDASSPITDQIHVPRPFPAGGSCDAGAIERQ